MLDRVIRAIQRIAATSGYKSKATIEGSCRIYENAAINATDVVVGDGYCAYPGSLLWGDGPIRIGRNVAVGKDTIIYAHAGGGVSIGDNTSIAGQCYVIDSDHGIERGRPIREQPMTTAAIVIEDDVWLGAGVKVLKGVTLRRGCVCAAGCVVTKDVPEYAIVAGVPAKIIGWRE